MTWERLSEASSQTPEHNCVRIGDKGCRRCRWFEVRLDRRPDDGEYRVSMIGRSTVRDEVDRIRVETTTSPAAVIDFLALGDPGHRYLPKVSRKALHEAADIDDALGDAFDDFDALTSP